MTDETPPDGEEVAGMDPVAASTLLLSETVEVVRLLMEQVRAGDFGRLDELAREQANLRKALAAAILERQHAQRLRRDEPADAAGALDLDAARAEIGRRLARLRSAADAKERAGQA